jgi:hypothetical protein
MKRHVVDRKRPESPEKTKNRLQTTLHSVAEVSSIGRCTNWTLEPSRRATGRRQIKLNLPAAAPASATPPTTMHTGVPQTGNLHPHITTETESSAGMLMRTCRPIHYAFTSAAAALRVSWTSKNDASRMHNEAVKRIG